MSYFSKNSLKRLRSTSFSKARRDRSLASGPKPEHCSFFACWSIFFFTSAMVS